MRNGLNIAGVSELVHEIQAVPEEALVRLGARLRPLGSDVGEARTVTLLGGTIRVARDFSFLVRPSDAQSERPALRAPSCDEYLLTALGGCVLVTFVQGCSARGITLMRASVKLTAQLGQDASGRPILDQVAYRYDVECDGAADVLVEIARYVSCLSPNHRAFVEAGPVAIDVSTSSGSTRPRRVVSEVAAPSSGVTARKCGVEVSWVYGTQLLARLESGSELVVDQPKQFLGLDSAANPQEFLLAASASEFAHALERVGVRRGVFVRAQQLETSGWLDLRGLTNLDETKPVRVHEIRHEALLDTPAQGDELDEIVAEAAGTCVTHAAICRENRIKVTLATRGELVFSFESNKAMLTEYLAELARRKREAAAGA